VVGATINHERCRLQLRGESTGFAVWECQDDDVMSAPRELARQRNVVRTIHERLYFRPLLDALAGAGRMSPDAAASALASFGFADAERTRQAVRELTRGLTRSSRMMQQLLPLLRFDGYYVLTDLTGVPDILSRIKPIFRSLR
jgi:hypothetical protein